MVNEDFQWNSELTHSFVKLYADTCVADVRIFDQNPMTVNLTGKELTYMYSIATIKNCTAKDLVKLFGVSKSMVSQVIAKLEKKKMVVRTTDTEDKRVHFIMLSPECTKEFSKKIEIVGRAVDKVRQKYSEKDIATSAAILSELSTQIIDIGIELGNKKNL